MYVSFITIAVYGNGCVIDPVWESIEDMIHYYDRNEAGLMKNIVLIYIPNQPNYLVFCMDITSNKTSWNSSMIEQHKRHTVRVEGFQISSGFS